MDHRNWSGGRFVRRGKPRPYDHKEGVVARRFDGQSERVSGRITRRQFVAIGVSLASVGLFAAACRGQEAQRQAPAAPATEAAKPTAAAKPAESKPAEAAKPAATQAAAQPAAATGGKLVIAGAKD